MVDYTRKRTIVNGVTSSHVSQTDAPKSPAQGLPARAELSLKYFFFFLFRAAPAAYVGPQARGQIGAVAASLHRSHSNMGSELPQRPTLQLTSMPDP